jgi:uncharacterized glyoxalase superfamily protein PhnB
MFKFAIPVLHVSSAATAEDFYCNQLGFSQTFAYRFDDSKPDPCYMGLTRDEVRLHVSSFAGDELKARGVMIDLEPMDQSWGNREMYVHDPDGNSIRFVHGAE